MARTITSNKPKRVPAVGPASPSARPGHGVRRQDWRRARWSLASLTVALLLLGTVAGVASGRPQVVWDLQPSNNDLTISLASGQGPLAAGLLSGSTVVAGDQRRRTVTLTLPAGQTSHVKVVITSIWSTTMTLTIPVPPQPALIGTTTDTTTVSLQFSMPVTPLNTLCGLPEGATLVTTLTFPRGTTSCSGWLEVLNAAGEEAQIRVSIPAVPPRPSPSPSSSPTPPPAPRPLPPAPAIYFGPADHGAFYITIDDGSTPDPRVIALMQRMRLPITSFLISNIAAGHLAFWRSFVAAGGNIEDHTVSHPDMTTLSEAADEVQWAGAAQAFRKWFGKTVTLGRPPYGTFNRNVQVAAGQAGLRYVVLWSASMYNQTLTTYDHEALRAGEIVILHWIPGMYDSLVRLLQIASALGLHPAALRPALG